MTEGGVHDPGPEIAGERGEAHATAAREPLTIGRASVRIGTASWTDPTMTAPGVFYPPDAGTAEERVLWSLEAQLEKRLSEPFQANYAELVRAARERVKGPSE